MAQLWCKVFPHKIHQIDDLYTQLHISPDHTQFNTLNQMIFLALISNTLYFSKPKHELVLQTPSMESSGHLLGTGDWESCAICSETVPTLEMVSHIRLRHSFREEIFKCDVCQQTFKNKSTLKRHKVKVLLLYLG